MTEPKDLRDTGGMARTFFTDPILRHDVDLALDILKAKMATEPVWIGLTDLAKAILEGPVGFPADSVDMRAFCRDLRLYLVRNGFLVYPRERIAGDLYVPVFRSHHARKAFLAKRPVGKPGRGDDRTRYDRFLRLKTAIRGAEVTFYLGDSVPPAVGKSPERQG